MVRAQDAVLGGELQPEIHLLEVVEAPWERWEREEAETAAKRGASVQAAPPLPLPRGPAPGGTRRRSTGQQGGGGKQRRKKEQQKEGTKRCRVQSGASGTCQGPTLTEPWQCSAGVGELQCGCSPDTLRWCTEVRLGRRCGWEWS